MINRITRLQRQHMEKYEPMMREAKRHMETLVQRYMLRNMVALAFDAGYKAGRRDGEASVKDEPTKLKKWKYKPPTPTSPATKLSGTTSPPTGERK